MRLNFTGRRKIDKQDARVAVVDDPVGSKRGHYFDIILALDKYKLPQSARIFVEAYKGTTQMRFDLGTVEALARLTPAQRRLADFGANLDRVKFRVKVTQTEGSEAGKLLAEADGILAGDGGGVHPLILLAGEELGSTPWRLELVPSDPDLPTLFINTTLGGKEYAKDPVARPLLLTAAAREVFSTLVIAGDQEDDPEHWASLWTRFATQILGLSDPPENIDENEDEIRQWVDSAVNAFAAKHQLAEGLAAYKAGLDREDLEEIS